MENTILIQYRTISWIITLCYLLWLTWFYFKSKQSTSTICIDAKTKALNKLSILQIGYMLGDQTRAYDAQTAFLLEEGYIIPAEDPKPFLAYKRTSRGRSPLDKFEKFHLNKLLFPEIRSHSTRDGGTAPHAPQLNEDKNKLWEMLSIWAQEKGFLHHNTAPLRDRLIGTVFLPLLLFFLLFCYLIFGQDTEVDLLQVIVSTLGLAFAGTLFMGNFLVTLLQKYLHADPVLPILTVIFTALTVMNYTLIQMGEGLSSWNNPFVALSVVIFAASVVWLSLDSWTQEGVAIQTRLIAYRDFLETNPKQADTFAHEVLFSLHQLNSNKTKEQK